jgi:hypothetical protein
MDIQKLFDTMSKISMDERSTYHVTLGEMINALIDVDHNKRVVLSDAPDAGLGRPMSYRGYYSDLAFDPTDGPTTVGKLLAECNVANGNTFEGYKGGEYAMGKDTPLWVAGYGDASGRAIVATTDTPDAFVLTIKKVA